MQVAVKRMGHVLCVPMLRRFIRLVRDVSVAGGRDNVLQMARHVRPSRHAARA